MTTKMVWGLVLGAGLAIVGLLVRLHYSSQAQLCSSGLGALGQALDRNIATDCSLVTTIVPAATLALVIGPILFLAGLVGLMSASRQRGQTGWRRTEGGEG